jgi:hypothetical protein
VFIHFFLLAKFKYLDPKTKYLRKVTCQNDNYNERLFKIQFSSSTERCDDDEKE